MIVVLADDLSGAAELAGIALQHGLTAEVQTAFHAAADVDVICLDTNTRLLTDVRAAECVGRIAREVVAAGPAWIFKKCDSVLRGPVLAEARALAQVTGQSRITLLPANPSRHRIIRDGCYFVEGRPLPETVFARDPVHPRTTARVTDLLGRDLAGVTLPDAQSPDDVLQQARALPPAALPVGAADFFRALLEVRTPRLNPRPAPPLPPGPTLLVCGSAASWPLRLAEAKARGLPAFPLPHDPAAIARTLPVTGRVLLGVGDGPATAGQSPESLATRLAESTRALLGETPVNRLMLEGGATAAAVLLALRWTRLRAVASLGGVAVLHPAGTNGPALFIKPGSYAWPAALWPER